MMKLWNVFGGDKKCFKNFSQKTWRVKLLGRHKVPGLALCLSLGTVYCFLRATEAEPWSSTFWHIYHCEV